MSDPYIAHPSHEGIPFQSISVHSRTVADLARRSCPVPVLAHLAYLAGIFHDAGKYGDGFQTYIKKIEQEMPVFECDRVDHATAGGQLVEALLPASALSQILQFVIYSHHGLYDAVSPDSGAELFSRRIQKEIELNKIAIDRYLQFCAPQGIKEILCEAQLDFKQLKEEILAFVKAGGAEKLYGSADFYMAMHVRLLLSLLVDSDRTDTACFVHNRPLPKFREEEELQELWQQGIFHLERHLDQGQWKGSGRIVSLRREISARCRDAAYENANSSSEGRPQADIYRLTVPTGSGKTLSSLRFALHCAKECHKRHIIYIAPFNSILEQNADEFRKALGNADIILEHHSNVVFEEKDQEKQEKYELLIENWDIPIIVTTAVQFLNTLFSSKLSNVRRMYQLCDSVIIFDEVQAIPIRCTQVFNLAVNYLAAFCNTTMVLCSATQPLFDCLRQNRIVSPTDMVGDTGRFTEEFRRTNIIDKTDLKPGGLTIGELSDFVVEQFERQKRILIIANTKACAENLYHCLEKRCAEQFQLFHLSTNMCAANRQEVLDQLKGILEKEDSPVICVSTQLIEAGVDISFDCVIRSLAGLDSIIQSAGRCNRHGKPDKGDVFIVRMSPEAENSSRLTDIRMAQEVMDSVLTQYRREPESMSGGLASPKAITLYYGLYFQMREQEMAYPVSGFTSEANLVDFLSGNNVGMEQWRKLVKQEKISPKGPPFIKQAFKTAGEKFQVIPEDGKIDIVVEYDDKVCGLLSRLQEDWIGLDEQKKIIRGLQRYTVGISEKMKTVLGRALTPIPVYGGVVLALNSGYYSRQTGVSETPVNTGLFTD